MLLGASLVDQLLEWLLPLFSYWGYLIVFTGVFLESIFLTGWIAPGTAVLLLGGFYAVNGGLNVWMIWATAVAGALVGDNVGYFIGRKLGGEVIERYGDRPRIRRGMERSQRFFSRYGGTTVIFGRMISGVDAFIPLTAGMNAMPHLKYLLFDLPMAVIWSGSLTALGYFFGANWRFIENAINFLGWGVFAVVAAVAAVVLLARRLRAGSGQN